MKHKILRLLKIWDERNIYDETFLADLSGLLTAHTKKSNQLSTAELIQEFQVCNDLCEIMLLKCILYKYVTNEFYIFSLHYYFQKLENVKF